MLGRVEQREQLGPTRLDVEHLSSHSGYWRSRSCLTTFRVLCSLTTSVVYVDRHGVSTGIDLPEADAADRQPVPGASAADLDPDLVAYYTWIT